MFCLLFVVLRLNLADQKFNWFLKEDYVSLTIALNAYRMNAKTLKSYFQKKLPNYFKSFFENIIFLWICWSVPSMTGPIGLKLKKITNGFMTSTLHVSKSFLIFEFFFDSLVLFLKFYDVLALIKVLIGVEKSFS